MALSSHLLNQRNADISATDYHPEAEPFMRVNTALNNGGVIPFKRTGWADTDTGLGHFDLIIGSDLLYEAGHSELLANFIDAHAKHTCEVVIVDPGRKQHAKFSREMVERGYSHEQIRSQNDDFLDKPFPGVILTYKR